MVNLAMAHFNWSEVCALKGQCHFRCLEVNWWPYNYSTTVRSFLGSFPKLMRRIIVDPCVIVLATRDDLIVGVRPLGSEISGKQADEKRLKIWLYSWAIMVTIELSSSWFLFIHRTWIHSFVVRAPPCVKLWLACSYLSWLKLEISNPHCSKST